MFRRERRGACAAESLARRADKGSPVLQAEVHARNLPPRLPGRRALALVMPVKWSCFVAKHASRLMLPAGDDGKGRGRQEGPARHPATPTLTLGLNGLRVSFS